MKENLHWNHVYMDFTEDYWCRSQEKIQSAYRSQTHFTSHPVITCYKQCDKLTLQSFIFIRDETNYDHDRYLPWDRIYNSSLLYLTLQQTFFKFLSCHKEYLNIVVAWNSIKIRHVKGPYYDISGITTRTTATGEHGPTTLL